MLSIDFETGSDVNLIKHGAYAYASDPSTRVHMMGWAFDDEPVALWWWNEPFPQRVADYVKEGGLIAAWNADFERLIWDYVMTSDYNLPAADMSQWRCTAYRARTHGLPSALADAARCLNIPLKKMDEGKRLIDLYCAHGFVENIPEPDRTLFGDYCKVDVEVERMLGRCLRDLSDDEWAVYHNNSRICDRGVPVDVEFAAAALNYAEEVRADVDSRIFRLTNGQVENSRKRKARDEWLRDSVPEALMPLITKPTGAITFDQRHRDNLTANEDVPYHVKEFVALIDEAGGATISKYKAMVDKSVKGRLHGVLVAAGAGQTGRYSSLGVQMHNLRRDGLEDPETIIDAVLDGYEIEDVTTTLSRAVRAAVWAPDTGLAWADYSNVEGRKAPWLAGSAAGERKLDLFRQGVDPYKYNAMATYHLASLDDVTDDQRQAGKVQELALGFLGGVGALKSMAEGFGLVLNNVEAEVMRDAWRAANPWAVTFGNELNAAAIRAIRKPKTECAAGRIVFVYDGADWLWARLPSGRYLADGQPRLETVMTPWGDETRAITCLWGSRRPKAGQKWTRRVMNRGIWLENVTQASANCLLRDALLIAEDEGIPVVLHVHDEIVALGGESVAMELKDLMEDLPDWAAGLPIEVKPGWGERYGK